MSNISGIVKSCARIPAPGSYLMNPRNCSGQSFAHYLSLEGKPISRAIAEQRMLEKLSRSLTEDIAPLLPAGVQFNDDDAMDAFNNVWTELVAKIKGDPWKLSAQVIDELRNGKMQRLLR